MKFTVPTTMGGRPDGHKGVMYLTCINPLNFPNNF